MSKGAGKGDKPRPVDADKYRDNYDRIFRKKKPKKKAGKVKVRSF